jgi:predicted DNA-binding transcriptional regulator AlpA
VTEHGLAAQLRALADRLAELAPAQVIGELEALKFQVWSTASNHAPAPAPTGPSRGLGVGVVVERTGMSRDWLYREARQGRLPFARRLGRRVVFDEGGLTRWLERRSGQRG